MVWDLHRAPQTRGPGPGRQGPRHLALKARGLTFGLPRRHWWWRTHLPMQEMWEMQFHSLGWEDPLEVGMVTHSSFLAWRIPWAEEPGGHEITKHQTELKRLSAHSRRPYFWKCQTTGCKKPRLHFKEHTQNLSCYKTKGRHSNLKGVWVRPTYWSWTPKEERGNWTHSVDPGTGGSHFGELFYHRDIDAGKCYF